MTEWWRRLPVLLAMLLAIIGGAMAWSQLDSQSQDNATRIGELSAFFTASIAATTASIVEIQKEQQQQGVLIGRIDERIKNTAEMQQRILNMLERMAQRASLRYGE